MTEPVNQSTTAAVTFLQNTSQTTESDQEMLESLSQAYFLQVVPTIVFCATLATLGTIGNSLSVYVFVVRMRRNFLNDLFIVLSGTSLLTCLVCLPGEINDLRHVYIYPSDALCKANRYFNLLSTSSLVITLCTLAVFRLRAAMSATSATISLRARLVTVTCLLTFATIFSLIALNVYGIKHILVNTTTEEGGGERTLIGRDCAVANDSKDTNWPMVFNLSMIAGFLFLITTTIVCYYRIWRLVVRSRMAVAAHVTSALPSAISQGGTMNNTRQTAVAFDSPGRTAALKTVKKEDELIYPVSPKEEGDLVEHLGGFNHTEKIGEAGEEIQTIIQDIKHQSHAPPFYAQTCLEGTDELYTARECKNGSREEMDTETKQQADDAIAFTMTGNSTPKPSPFLGDDGLLRITEQSRDKLEYLNNGNNSSLKMITYQSSSICSSAESISTLTLADTTTKETELDVTQHTDRVRANTATHVIGGDHKDELYIEKTEMKDEVVKDVCASPELNCLASIDIKLRNNEVAQPFPTETTLTSSVKDLRVTGGSSNGKEASTSKDNISAQLPNSTAHTPDSFAKASLSENIDKQTLTKASFHVKTNTLTTEPLTQTSHTPTRSNSVAFTNNSGPITTPVNLFTTKPRPPNERVDVYDNTHTSENETADQKRRSLRSRQPPKSSLEQNITRTALLLAVIFIVCYVPFFCVSIPALLYPQMGYDRSTLNLNIIHLAYRFYFITPAINPIVFYASNTDFKRKLKALVVDLRSHS